MDANLITQNITTPEIVKRISEVLSWKQSGDGECGFLLDSDGNQWYFHMSIVIYILTGLPYKECENLTFILSFKENSNSRLAEMREEALTIQNVLSSHLLRLQNGTTSNG